MMQDNSVAYQLAEGRLLTGTVAQFLPFLDDGRRHVISLVGGGGKTTTMYYLAACFQQRGKRVAIMTTTKIGRPAAWCSDMAACRECWHAGQYAVCGVPFGDGKLTAPDDSFLRMLLDEADIVLIEADGARSLPCKAPASHEPVILPETDTVIALMGLDACGKPISEVCFRPELVAEILRTDVSHRLTPADMAALLLSDRGARKHLGVRRFYVLLNKCDVPERVAFGKEILAILAKAQCSALLTSGMVHSEQYEYP